jgi:hypothetical protein
MGHGRWEGPRPRSEWPRSRKRHTQYVGQRTTDSNRRGPGPRTAWARPRRYTDEGGEEAVRARAQIQSSWRTFPQLERERALKTKHQTPNTKPRASDQQHRTPNQHPTPSALHVTRHAHALPTTREAREREVRSARAHKEEADCSSTREASETRKETYNGGDAVCYGAEKR